MVKSKTKKLKKGRKSARGSRGARPSLLKQQELSSMQASKKCLTCAGCRKCTSLSEFRRAVYALCKQVPQGKVTTYGSIARAISQSRTASNAARAVGTALRNNPFAPVVPCHRVIKSDLSIGGFSGSTQFVSPNVQRKIDILKREGVDFAKNGRLVSDESVVDEESLRLKDGDTDVERLRAA